MKSCNAVARCCTLLHLNPVAQRAPQHLLQNSSGYSIGFSFDVLLAVFAKFAKAFGSVVQATVPMCL